HAETQGRCGRDGIGQHDGNAGGRDNFGAGVGKSLRAEPRVVADANALRGIFLRRSYAGMDVRRDGLGSGAHVSESEVVGDNAAPAVGAEFDDGMRHGWVLVGEKQRSKITGGAGIAHGALTFPTELRTPTRGWNGRVSKTRMNANRWSRGSRPSPGFFILRISLCLFS